MKIITDRKRFTAKSIARLVKKHGAKMLIEVKWIYSVGGSKFNKTRYRRMFKNGKCHYSDDSMELAYMIESCFNTDWSDKHETFKPVYLGQSLVKSVETMKEYGHRSNKFQIVALHVPVKK